MTFAESFRQNFLRPPDLSKLPARVRARIREREWGNEIVLRMIQLGIILMFCFIYAISPKTAPAGVFSPVPYVLAAYLALSVIGLTWGLLREPPDWASYISILFDFCLLYGLMISFHIQYQQPASFTLKAPALLYGFIFIAIRALRFHPKFVLAAGAVAALGWAAMIVYVTRIDPGDNMLTRSYVAYLTSNSILIGAEVDKILSILFVTGVLALAVNGSNNLLVTAIAEQSAAADLSRFFDSSVAREIRSSAAQLQAGDGARRRAAIMYVDLRGFSRLAARLEPGEVMAILAEYQGRVVPIVRDHGGVIDKFLGDGIMATFGTLREGTAFAEAAVRAAEAILERFTAWQPRPGIEIGIGIGIASGDVSWGAVGLDDRLEMTVIGPAVNLAAKLEKHNKETNTRCIVDGETWRLALEQGYDGKLGARLRTAAVEGIEGRQRIAILRPAKRPTRRPSAKKRKR